MYKNGRKWPKIFPDFIASTILTENINNMSDVSDSSDMAYQLYIGSDMYK